MFTFSDLPAVNATLNGTSAVLLTLGYRFIKRRRVFAHKMCMGGALGVSGLFLISYVTYHLWHGVTRFGGTGWVRLVYFSILGSHTVLAVAVVPLALVTLVRALRGQWDRHVRIARITFPIWLYVSVTGVVVYWMLYHWPLASQ